MLMYKGINYLENALNQRQKFLQKCVVSVPHHLEHVDMYRHSGKLPDTSFREPWKRATADRELLKNEGTRLETELNCLSELVSEQIKEIESLGRDSFDCVEHGVFDLGECIPSSNPSSQEDLQEVFQLEEKNSLNLKEIFSKENIQYWLSACSSDSFKLEEVFMSDPLPDLSRNLPSLNAMCGRLHPNQVSDPLNSRGSGLLALKDRIAQNEIFVQEDHCDLVRCEASSEEWQKFELNGADGELEECVFPFEKEKGKKEAIINSTKIAIELGTSRPLEVKSPASDMFDRLTKRDVRNKYRTGVEEVNTEQSFKFSQSFLEINEIGYDDDLNIKKALLDSPMVRPCVERQPNYDLKHSLAQLCSHPLTEGNNRLLALAQKENIIWKIWQHEKYLDDVLSLRLPEFERKPTFNIDIGPHKAKEMLNLKADEDLGKIELSLCWDAVSLTAAKNKGCQVEKLKEADSYKCPLTVMFSVEQFKKDTSTTSLEDPVLEISTSPESSEDMKESKTKDEKAIKVWKPPVRSCAPLRLEGLKKAGFDPLNDFLLLRSVQSVSMESHGTSKALARTNTRSQVPKADQNFPVMIKTNDSPQMSPSDLDIQNIGVIKPNKRQKTWDHRVVYVTLQGEFAAVLEIIEDQAYYYMAALQGSDGIHLPNNFSDITPDNTRFLVKQKEKSLQDNKEDGTACDLYKATVALHILCGARDILINCCFESVLAHFKSMQEKYQSVLKNCFDDMRKQLFQLKCNFNQRRIFHPKLVSLYRHIDLRLQKSTQERDGTKEKILIVTGQDRTTLKCCLRDFVRGGSAMKADLLTDLSGELSKRLELVTCLISHRSELFDEFPWSQFTAVMDYNDSGEDTKLQDLCKAHGLPLISFNVKSKHVSAGIKTGSTTEDISLVPKNKETVATLTIIGSRYLTSRPELLQLLETRHNLMILERDYDQIRSIDEMYFADLVIDEKTCVVVQSVQDMAEVWQYELLHSKIITLSLKFTTCWIIFYSSQKISKKHSPCIENISRFQAAVGNLTRKQDFVVKTFISDNANETAMFVRQVCDTSEKMSAVWKDGSWGQRMWLAEECSEEEKTLLSFPCFNSFSAQFVLQKMSVSELLASSFSELVVLFPWMPQKFLKSFLEMVHSERRVNLLSKEESHDSCQKTDPVEDPSSTLEDYETSTFQQNQSWLSQTSENTFKSEPFAMDKHKILKKNLRNPHCQYKHFIDSKHQEVLDLAVNKSIDLHSANSPGEVSDRLDEAQFGMDTQDSEDILSLNGSQPSVKLNEFQRAEIEGRNAIAYTNRPGIKEESMAGYTNLQGTWNTNREIQQDEIREESMDGHRNPEENTESSHQEIPQNVRRLYSEFSLQGFQKRDDQKNMKLTTTGVAPAVAEDAFEQAVNLEVARRLKVQQGQHFNTFRKPSVCLGENASDGDVRNNSLYDDHKTYDGQDRNPIKLQSQHGARKQIPSANFSTMNYHSQLEDSRVNEKENLLQGTYCPVSELDTPVSELDFQLNCPMISTQRKQYMDESREEEKQYLHPREIQDTPCGDQTMTNNMYGQIWRESNLGSRLGLQENGAGYKKQVRRPSQGQRSFAGDLTLVTQNILQKATSCELPIKTSMSWPPHRRVSIGLAPPRPREDSTIKDHVHEKDQSHIPVQTYPDTTLKNTLQRSHLQSSYDGQMKGRSGNYSQESYGTPQWNGHSSLWSSYDSPPMDLDKSPDKLGWMKCSGAIIATCNNGMCMACRQLG
ncbi:protein shortage in chiasmata 1 ortholog-like [Pecten maximus]|uniref:protein shortage in chiasmata 1 ortholog-like n=1 Tax=Pecten maximus TaxID=6579 RepID=UPI001458DBA0|nr:protein shortage in chiasmata 1 ortholog-like [Pecten maximus]